MICCLRRLALACLSLGLIALLASSVPAGGKDKKDSKDKKPQTKKEEKQPEPKKEEKPDVPLLTCKGHTDWVYHVDFSADGRLLVSSGRDKTVKVWDAATAKEVKTVKGLPQGAKAVEFLPENRFAGTTGKWEKAKKAWEGEILIWDIKAEQPKIMRGHSDVIEALAVSADGKKLASASDDQTALIWELPSGNVAKTLKGHTDAILGVAFAKDGAKVATASKDKTVKIWDVSSGKDVLTLKNPPPAPKKTAAPPEAKKVKDTKDKQGKQDKGKQGKAKKEMKAKEQPPVDPTRDMTSVAFGPAGDRVAAGNLDGTVKIWSTANGKELLNLKGREGDGIWAIAFSPDGKRLAAGGWEKVIYVFDAGNGKTLFTLRAHTDSITSLAFSPDGGRLASSSLDQTVKIWDMKR